MELENKPKTDFHKFDPTGLPEVLKLKSPQFSTPDEAFRQLRYVAEYANGLGCQCIVVESHYIDRDHIEDHSVFYSKSLHPYPNSCRRIHFFSAPRVDVEHRLRKVVEIGLGQGVTAYRQACRDFSDEAYLGFLVLKPLAGSPVGRTVLRTFPEVPTKAPDDQLYRRVYSPARTYLVHLLGVELTVTGLAFQQQDVGVSACATTAIWSSLQKMRDHEDVAAATPAQITLLAAKYSLPFGRSMPSEGLSLDQMCQSVQAVGLSPNTFRVDDAATIRGYLYTAIKSGFAPVLILKSKLGTFHAVTAVGMKVRAIHEATLISNFLDDSAGDLVSLYIHDDRWGPYLAAELTDFSLQPRRLDLQIKLSFGSADRGTEVWQVTHVLISLHSKIRLSFAGLREISQQVANNAGPGYANITRIDKSLLGGAVVQFENQIIRAHRYIESLVIDSSQATVDRIDRLARSVSLARYLGVVRLRSAYFAPIDVLIDTTSTRKNAHCLAVVAAGTLEGHTEFVGRHLAAVYDCEFVR